MPAVGPSVPQDSPLFGLWGCQAHMWAVLMAIPMLSPHWKNNQCLHRHRAVCPLQGSQITVFGFAVPWLPALPVSFDLGLSESCPPRVCRVLYLCLCWQTFLGKDIYSCDFSHKPKNKRLPANARGQAYLSVGFRYKVCAAPHTGWQPSSKLGSTDLVC